MTIFIIAAIGSEVLGSIRAPARGAPRPRAIPGANGMIWAGLALLVLVVLPALAGSYIGQVLMLVGLYILMGMGLNLEVGLAGLLDLGFVAFFAVGAYTTALLTADSSARTDAPVLLGGHADRGRPRRSASACCSACRCWACAAIIWPSRRWAWARSCACIVQSDFAAPLLGGAQGILQIPKPRLGAFVLGNPVSLFYLTLVCFRGRRVRRLAAGEFAPRPRLDGVARR